MPEKDKNIQIVCVSNNADTFHKVINSNPNMNKYNITMFDNLTENIGISKRYNSYIENQIDSDNDSWIIFCHQDFGFKKDPIKYIKNLDKKNIYGPIGAFVYFNPIRLIKKYLMNKPAGYSCLKRKFVGQIKQMNSDSTFKNLGTRLWFPIEVDTLDCCCLIVHSSLIKKYALRFDEQLDWHMYVEDFCINCKKTHGIKTKVVQLDCFHLGIGTLDDDFYKAAKYVKEKHSLKFLKTTCIND